MRIGRARSDMTMMVLLAVAAITACDGPGSTRGKDAGVTVRDSAGVTIVENATVEPANVARWTVDTTPSVTIGVSMGDSAYELTSVGGVRRLPNGMIVVLNGQGEEKFEFRFYDSTGKHVVTHGRRGQGPGEYRWINFFGPVGGDTVIGVDFPNARLNWVSASRGYLRSSRLDDNAFRKTIGGNAGRAVESMVPFGDSVYATKVYHEIAVTAPPQRSMSFHILDMKANTSVELVRYADPLRKAVEISSGPRYIWPLSAGTGTHVVDRERRRICAGITSVAEIVCIDPQGKRRIIRWRPEEVPYTDADREEYKTSRRSERALRAGGLTPGDAERIIAATEWPERHHPFVVLQIDTEGNFWVLEPTVKSGVRRMRFRVFDPDGRHIAFADSFPVRNVSLSNTSEIGERSVIRVFEDADGVPIVGVFAIRKPD